MIESPSTFCAGLKAMMMSVQTIETAPIQSVEKLGVR